MKELENLLNLNNLNLVTIKTDDLKDMGENKLDTAERPQVYRGIMHVQKSGIFQFTSPPIRMKG